LAVTPTTSAGRGALRSTFLHLPGFSPWSEVELWRAGILDWSEFRDHPTVPGVDPRWKGRYDRELEGSEAAYRARSVAHFARRLPFPEHWRLYPEFHDVTGFLDIETTSLSPFDGIVTVVTVHGRGATRSFIADEDLGELPAYLRPFQVLVTFNGLRFDVPFLEATFPNWVPPPGHIDLWPLFRRIGRTGGLKRIEQQLGIGNRSGVEGIHGLDAVRLWESYRRGQRESLDLLVEYNRADTVNLEPLLDYAVAQMTERLGLRRPPAT
jgi:uncharacterized protein YprB with RNaseH-like and TPR domain